MKWLEKDGMWGIVFEDGDVSKDVVEISINSIVMNDDEWQERIVERKMEIVEGRRWIKENIVTK